MPKKYSRAEQRKTLNLLAKWQGISLGELKKRLKSDGDTVGQEAGEGLWTTTEAGQDWAAEEGGNGRDDSASRSSWSLRSLRSLWSSRSLRSSSFARTAPPAASIAFSGPGCCCRYVVCCSCSPAACPPPFPLATMSPLYSTAAMTSITGDSPDDLRLEASTAKRALRNVRRRRKDARDADVDWIIKLLLLLASSSDGDAAAALAVCPSSSLLSPPPLIPPLPSARALANRMWEGRAMLLKSIVNVVKRLHERETNAAVGPRGYLSREQGGVFLLGDYENNRVDSRRAEGERVSGLLDQKLDVTVMLDKERGGSSSSS